INRTVARGLRVLGATLWTSARLPLVLAPWVKRASARPPRRAAAVNSVSMTADGGPVIVAEASAVAVARPQPVARPAQRAVRTVAARQALVVPRLAMPTP